MNQLDLFADLDTAPCAADGCTSDATVRICWATDLLHCYLHQLNLDPTRYGRLFPVCGYKIDGWRFTRAQAEAWLTSEACRGGTALGHRGDTLQYWDGRPRTGRVRDDVTRTADDIAMGIAAAVLLAQLTGAGTVEAFGLRWDVPGHPHPVASAPKCAASRARATCRVCEEVCDVDEDRRLVAHPARDVDGEPHRGFDCHGSGSAVAVRRIRWSSVNVPVGSYL